MTRKTDLKSLSREGLTAFISGLEEKPFRAEQIWNWLYARGVSDFQHMTNLSKAFRERLETVACISRLELEDRQVSKKTGTVKYLWRLEDGREVESVYIPDGNRHTICISTQVGCALGCDICATARIGFTRDLTVSEIVNQVMDTAADMGRKPTNIVVMGMGEPFLNYDNLITALYIINSRDGLAVSHRRITISTAGIAPLIRRYAGEGHPFKLAISLHATTDSVRSRIMPINRKYPLKDLMAAAGVYARTARDRLTFEYVLIDGINDSKEDARRLRNMLRTIPCKVNLISYNAGGNSRYAASPPERVRVFTDEIRHLLAPVTLRLSRGDDINGACGQLAGKKGRSPIGNTETEDRP
ncbi:23S rRNA (adenine(2503)-C(2))-methyltransferase RlmN [bacterium]|nr:23S rRNA (adenine(2503)-C(2))-methyltransferase RlmN [bacterium]